MAKRVSTYQPVGYTPIGWDPTKKFNPSNMNHMDDGIKAVADRLDVLGPQVGEGGGATNLVYDDYATMISSINAMANDELEVGNVILIRGDGALTVWVSEINSIPIPYTHVSDSELSDDLQKNGSIIVGYYTLAKANTNTTATDTQVGLVKPDGITTNIDADGTLHATDTNVYATTLEELNNLIAKIPYKQARTVYIEGAVCNALGINNGSAYARGVITSVNATVSDIEVWWGSAECIHTSVRYNPSTSTVTSIKSIASGMISDVWNGTLSYSATQYVIDENILYKCLMANINKKPKDNPTYWERTSVANELNEAKNKAISYPSKVSIRPFSAYNTWDKHNVSWTADDDGWICGTAGGGAGTSINITIGGVQCFYANNSSASFWQSPFIPVKKGSVIRVIVTEAAGYIANISYAYALGTSKASTSALSE